MSHPPRMSIQQLSHLGHFGHYFTKGKAIARPTSKENCLYFLCLVHHVSFCKVSAITTQLSAARCGRATRLFAAKHAKFLIQFYFDGSLPCQSLLEQTSDHFLELGSK